MSTRETVAEWSSRSMMATMPRCSLQSSPVTTNIDIVVQLDVMLAFVGSQQSSDVLDDATLERERESEEQRVKLGPVEPFAEVGTGRHERDPGVRVASEECVAHGGASFGAEPAAIGEVVPVLRGSPSVRSVALDEDVPGQPGNTQLDVDVVPQARSGERAELPVACGEAGTR